MGKCLFNGGEVFAIGKSAVFDYQTETWTETADMNRYRWYPSSIQLGDGTVWTFGGQNKPADVESTDPTIEFYSPDNNSWTMAGGQDIPGQYLEAYKPIAFDAGWEDLSIRTSARNVSLRSSCSDLEHGGNYQLWIGQR